MAKSLNSIIKLTIVSEVVVKMYLLKIKYIYVLIAKQNKGNFYCETAKMTSSIFSSFPLGERGSLGMRYVKIIFSKGIILQDLMKKPMYSTLKIKMDNLPDYIPCELLKSTQGCKMVRNTRNRIHGPDLLFPLSNLFVDTVTPNHISTQQIKKWTD